MINVAICICTYKRQELLQKLIKSLINQEYIEDVFYRLIVVDNYGEDNLREKLNQFCNSIDITYEIEVNRGISYARNKCMYIAQTKAVDYIIFVDDDEWVEKDWLKNMIYTAKYYNADVVKGSVKTLYNSNTPKWIINTNFYKEKEYQTGQILQHCAAGNTLVKVSKIKECSVIFDINYGLSGGEDTKFFRQISMSNGKIIYCKEAKAYEYLPQQRESMRYMFKRLYAGSSTYSRIEEQFSVGYLYKVLRLLKALIHLFQGIILLPFMCFKGKEGIFKAFSKCVKGAGQIVGSCGKIIRNY